MSTVLPSIAPLPDSSHSEPVLPHPAARHSTAENTVSDSNADFANMLTSYVLPRHSNKKAHTGQNSETANTSLTTASTQVPVQDQSDPMSAIHAYKNRDADENAIRGFAIADSQHTVVYPQGFHPDIASSLRDQKSTTIGSAASDTAALLEQINPIIAAISRTGRTLSENIRENEQNVDKVLSASLAPERPVLTTAAAIPSPHSSLRTDHSESTLATQRFRHLAHASSRPDGDSTQATPVSRTKSGPGASTIQTDLITLKQTSSHDQIKNSDSDALKSTAHVSESPNNAQGTTATTFNPILSAPQLHTSLAPATAPTIMQPLYSQQWAPEFSRQLVSFIRSESNGNHRVDLRLDPPELGPLRVTINLNDSVVHALFSSAHASVRNAVEQALPQLQQQFEQEGLSLGHASVDHHDQATETFHEAGAQRPTSRGQHEPATGTVSVPSPRTSNALIDTFA